MKTLVMVDPWKTKDIVKCSVNKNPGGVYEAK